MSTLKISGALKVGALASSPPNPEVGFIYYDTGLGKFQLYTAGGWVQPQSAEALSDITGAATVGYDRSGRNNIGLSDTTVQLAITALDDTIGALASSPANYTPVDATVVASHLAAIDAALAGIGSTDFAADVFRISDPTDATKKIAFSAATIGAGTVRTVTMPNANVNLGQVNTGIQQDGSRAFSADQSFGNFKATNLADPTNPQDAATKAYVDALRQGLDVKDSVRAASTANIDLTTGGLITVDGVALASGDRVLVKNQSTGSQNGIYAAAAGAWVRSTDANTSAKVTSGMFTFVEEGTTQASGGWVLQTADPITLGTTALTFVQFSGAGQIVAGSGLTKSGNTLNVVVDNTTIEISSNQVRVKDGGITDAKVATGINATKIGAGAVTNTAFGYVSGLTSDAQTQINNKLSTVSQDTTPALGGNLDVAGNRIGGASSEVVLSPQTSVRRAKHASPTNFVEEEYIHSIALNASQTGQTISALTFAFASFEGLEMTYKIKQATTNNVRIGTLRVVTNGTSVAIVDTSTETADVAIAFSAVINGSNVEVKYTSGTNSATLRADIKRIAA